MAGGAAPVGTVTFLFTDIADSTRLWDEHPAEMRVAVERHDAILREAIESGGGYVFSTAGDGLAAAFGRAGDALDAAVAVQRHLDSEPWPEPVVVSVRMGLHTGEAQERDGDYFGTAVNRAARIMSAGHGGQILVSSTTAGLLADADTPLRPVGEVRLSGLSRPETVCQVVVDGLPSEFPPLRSTTAPVGNLPHARDSFVGRGHDLSELAELLKSHRAITLTGVGGVGKTRLALAAAEAASGEFDDGAWFVELAEVLDGSLVAQAVASELAMQPRAGAAVLETVVQVLEPQRLLLVLDNCEHVLDDAAALVEATLRRAPEVVVLATSREGLGLAGERLVAVRSLDVDGVESPAVELFVDRAAQTGWAPAPGELNDVGELCRHLDGVPLAIELAAARARAMSPNDMLDRLGERFRLLKGRRRSIERHQTLRATVGWSYDLLTPDEQRLFDRLSVFTGSFELAAAEDVCAGNDLDELDIDDLLGALVDKSMVTAAAGRFVLLETLRQFGEERLAETDDPDRFRHAHLAHYRRFVIDAHDGLWGPDQAAWWTRLDATWANVRSAFRWAIETDDTDAAITIATHLGTAAIYHEPHEPYAWAAEVTSCTNAPAHPLYPPCLGIAAMGAFTEGDLARAEPLAEAAVAGRSDPSADLDRLALNSLSVVRLWQGRTDEAIDLMSQIVDEAAAAGRLAQQASWIASVAMAHAAAARVDEAVSMARQAEALAEPTGNPTARSWSRWAEGYALSEPDPATAVPILEQALTIAESADITWVTVSCRRVLAHAYTLLGNNTEALELALDSVRACRRQGAWAHVWNYLFYAAITLEALGHAESAARLLGGVSTSAAAGIERVQRLSRELEQRLARGLGEATAAALIDEGRRLTPQQAVDLAESAAAAHVVTSG